MWEREDVGERGRGRERTREREDVGERGCGRERMREREDEGEREIVRLRIQEITSSDKALKTFGMPI